MLDYLLLAFLLVYECYRDDCCVVLTMIWLVNVVFLVVNTLHIDCSWYATLLLTIMHLPLLQTRIYTTPWHVVSHVCLHVFAHIPRYPFCLIASSHIGHHCSICFCYSAYAIFGPHWPSEWQCMLLLVPWFNTILMILSWYATVLRTHQICSPSTTAL